MRTEAKVAAAYGHLLRRMPLPMRAEFGAEMQIVFAAALADAHDEGWAAVTRLCLREGVGTVALWCEYLRWNRRARALWTARWLTRAGSLFLTLFISQALIMSLVTGNVFLYALPFVFTLLTLNTLLIVAWWKEAAGARLILLVSVLLGLTAMLLNYGHLMRYREATDSFALIVLSASWLWSLPYCLLALMYRRLARESERPFFTFAK